VRRRRGGARRARRRKAGKGLPRDSKNNKWDSERPAACGFRIRPTACGFPMPICPAACGFSSLYLLPGAAVLGRRGRSVGGPGQGSTAASAATVRQWPCKSTLQLAQFLWFVWLEAIEIHRAQSGGSGKSLPGCLALGFIRQQPATHAQWECQRDNGAPGRSKPIGRCWVCQGGQSLVAGPGPYPSRFGVRGRASDRPRSCQVGG
jgi:hypothetical protein